MIAAKTGLNYTLMHSFNKKAAFCKAAFLLSI